MSQLNNNATVYNLSTAQSMREKRFRERILIGHQKCDKAIKWWLQIVLTLPSNLTPLPHKPYRTSSSNHISGAHIYIQQLLDLPILLLKTGLY